MTAAAAPRSSPARTASWTRAIERAGDEDGGGEHEDHRRVVRHRRQPERLREELLAEALLVAVDEERDGRERRDDPQERRPVPEQPAADPAREVVDAQQRDRAEDEHLEHDEWRQHLHVRRPRDPHDRRERVRPQVPELRRRELQLAEQPALRRRARSDRLPGTTPSRCGRATTREPDRRADLQADQRRRARRADARGARRPVRPLQRAALARASGDRHRRPPSGTRRPCARARRAAASALRSRRARGPRAVDAPAWLAVRLRRVPDDGPLKPVTSAISSARSRIDISCARRPG